MRDDLIFIHRRSLGTLQSVFPFKVWQGRPGETLVFRSRSDRKHSGWVTNAKLIQKYTCTHVHITSGPEVMCTCKWILCQWFAPTLALSYSASLPLTTVLMLPQALLRLFEVRPLPCPGGDMLGLPTILLAHLCKYYKGVERAERWEPGNLIG